MFHIVIPVMMMILYAYNARLTIPEARVRSFICKFIIEILYS